MVAYAGRDLHLFGELDELFASIRGSRVQYNPDKGVYEGEAFFLKQGYYNYAYISTIRVRLATVSLANTGNFNTTENYYTVLVYYRSFGAAPTNSAMRWLIRPDALTGFLAGFLVMFHSTLRPAGLTRPALLNLGGRKAAE